MYVRQIETGVFLWGGLKWNNKGGGGDGGR